MTMQKTPFLGVLRVETPFERAPGDSANVESWNFPVKIKILKDSTVHKVVDLSNDYPQDFIDGWVDLIQEFIDEGAVAAITSCGFLSAIHPILRKRFPGFPIGTSALLQIPIANNLVELGKRVGIITFNENVLGKKHLNGVGVDYDVPIVGVEEGCSFYNLIRKCDPFNYEEHEKDVVAAAKKLVSQYDDIGGIILECANMGPYRLAVQKATNLPVWDIITLGDFVYDVGLARSFNK